MHRRIGLTVSIAALLAAQPAFAADLEKGKSLFAQRCATCHGNTGAGDGPVALSLPENMKPRNLQDGAFKYATDDAKMKELLKKGGAAVGLNAMMPPQPDLSDADLDSVIAFLHTLQKAH